MIIVTKPIFFSLDTVQSTLSELISVISWRNILRFSFIFVSQSSFLLHVLSIVYQHIHRCFDILFADLKKHPNIKCSNNFMGVDFTIYECLQSLFCKLSYALVFFDQSAVCKRIVCKLKLILTRSLEDPSVPRTLERRSCY